MTLIEKQQEKDLFKLIQKSLADQGKPVKDISQFQALMVGNINITKTGFVTVIYLNDDILCTYTDPVKNNGVYTYKYNDEICQLKLSLSTITSTLLYKAKDLLLTSRFRLHRLFAKAKGTI